MRKIIVLTASAVAFALPVAANAAPSNIVGGTEAVHAIGLSTVWGSSVVRLAKHSARRADRPIGLNAIWGSSVVGPVRRFAPRVNRPVGLSVVWGT